MASIIYVKKQDDLAKVVEKIITASENEVILVIPKNSNLAKSYFNFEILKREAKLAKKELFIDSLDEIVRNFASQAKIKLIEHAFEEKEKRIIDILPPEKEGLKKEPLFEKKEPRFEKIDEIWKVSKEKPSLKKEIELPKKSRRKIYLSLSLIFLGSFFLVYLFWFYLPKATIVLYPKKTQKIIETSIAFAPIEEIDFENKVLPAKLVKFERVFEENFKATGKKKIETYARGKIKVFNAYSSEPQILVKRTRFLGEKSKKLFYLTKRIVIPGAKVIEGKIVPSFVEAEIIAAEPGKEYNIGFDKFWLPAFKESGSPRYYKVWGEAIEEIKGGEIKEVSVIKEEDLNRATSTLKKILTASLETEFFEKTKDYLLPGKSYQIKIEYENLPKPGEEKENFTLKGKATLEGFVVKKDDFENFSKTLLSQSFNLEKWKIVSIKGEFSSPEFDPHHPLLRENAKISIILARKIDPSSLKEKVKGKEKEELEEFLSNFEPIEKAKVIFWPFWVKKVPKNFEKIFIEIKT